MVGRWLQSRRRLLTVLAVAAAAGVLPLTLSVAGAVSVSAADPSAISDRGIFWIAVSPAYEQTGLVLVIATPTSGCQTNCTHLWVSHSGGSSWGRSPATGWRGGRPVIVVDGSGHEVVYGAAGSSSVLQRSDDDGATWADVGTSGGTPVPFPSYTHDGRLAVADDKSDYVLGPTGETPVHGSGGSLADFSFALSPSFPSGGSHAAALLSAADRSSGNPVIQRCDASLSCTGSTSLPGAGTYAEPVTLLPSTGYADDGVVFAQAGRGVYKSADGGTTFAPLPVGAQGATATATPMLAIGPGYRESDSVRPVFVATLSIFTNGTSSHTSGGVMRSLDGGASWSPVGSPSPFDGGATAVAVAPDGRLFGGYLGSQGTSAGGGLLCSTDQKTWQTSCPSVGSYRTGSTAAGPAGGGGGGTSASSCSGSACSTGAHPSTQAAHSGTATAQPGGAAATGAASAQSQSGGSGGAVSGAALPGQVATSSGGSSGSHAAAALIGLICVLAAAIGGAMWWRHRMRGSPTPPR